MALNVYLLGENIFSPTVIPTGQSWVFSCSQENKRSIDQRFLHPTGFILLLFPCEHTYQVLHLFLKSHQCFSRSDSKHISVHIFIIHCYFYLLWDRKLLALIRFLRCTPSSDYQPNWDLHLLWRTVSAASVLIWHFDSSFITSKPKQGGTQLR